MSDNNKKSVSQERKVNCYPSPVLLQKLESYANATEQSKSAVVCEALNSYLKDKSIPVTRGKE